LAFADPCPDIFTLLELMALLVIFFHFLHNIQVEVWCMDLVRPRGAPMRDMYPRDPYARDPYDPYYRDRYLPPPPMERMERYRPYPDEFGLC
jgi:pyruvate-formate lyase-activating enzyme